MHDYIWRWDTDWFWCSGAFGVQNPTVRRLWPDKYKRSDVYRKLVAYDRRYHIVARARRWRGLRPREDVIQDIEVPVERLPEFLEFFHAKVGMSPIWLCPLRAKERWPLYPLEAGRTYVNATWGRSGSRPARSPSTTTGSSNAGSRRSTGTSPSLDGLLRPGRVLALLRRGDLPAA